MFDRFTIAFCTGNAVNCIWRAMTAEDETQLIVFSVLAAITRTLVVALVFGPHHD